MTHHTRRLHGLGHVASVGLAPEHVTVETVAADVHDEAEGVHVVADAHEGQEADATLDQHFAFILLTKTLRREKKKKSELKQTKIQSSTFI